MASLQLKTITTQREWHAVNWRPLAILLLKSTVLVSMALFVGFVVAWKY